MAVAAGDHKISVDKQVGRSPNFSTYEQEKNIMGQVGIAHTRWATHGKVTATNAHPISSENYDWHVVHNGIVTNYKELKQTHLDRFSFHTETDTEVIANLLQSNERSGYIDGMGEIGKIMKGDNAFLALDRKFPHLIFSFANGQALYYSKVGGVIRISSDVNSLTGNIYQVPDKSVGVFNKTNGYFHSIENKEQITPSLIKRVKVKTTPKKTVEKTHFMLAEINEQIFTAELINKIKVEVPLAGNFNLVGCGSSYHACLFGERLLESRDINAKSYFASEYINRYRENTAVLGLTQSGETFDTLKALEESKKKSIVWAVCNEPTSRAAREFNSVCLGVGPEYGVAATKTFTAQCGFFLKLVDHKEWFEELYNAVDYVLRDLGRVDRWVGLYGDCKSFFFLGKGFTYPIALEGALKLKEVAYVHAEGFSCAELKHGPLALIDESTVSFVLEKSPALEEIKTRGGHVVDLSDLILVGSSEPVKAIALNIYLQMFAYKMALHKQIDPDHPRNLAKSVTVG